MKKKCLRLIMLFKNNRSLFCFRFVVAKVYIFCCRLIKATVDFDNLMVVFSVLSSGYCTKLRLVYTNF